MSKKLRRTPTQARSKDTVRVIVAGTIQVLCKNGGRDPSMAAIARSAGVSVGSVYQYFACKDDLLDAVAQELLDEIKRAAEPVFAHPEPGEAEMRAFYREVVVAHAGRLPAYRYLHARGVARGADQLQMFEAWLAEAFADVAVRTGTAEDQAHGALLARDVSRALRGLIVTALQYDEELATDRMVDQWVAVTVALATPPD